MKFADSKINNPLLHCMMVVFVVQMGVGTAFVNAPSGDSPFAIQSVSVPSAKGVVLRGQYARHQIVISATLQNSSCLM